MESKRSSDARHFEKLLQYLLDDEISDQQLGELEELLRDNPARVSELRWQLALSDRLSQYEHDVRDADRFIAAIKIRQRASNDEGDFVRQVLASARSEPEAPDAGTVKRRDRSPKSNDRFTWRDRSLLGIGGWLTAAATIVVLAGVLLRDRAEIAGETGAPPVVAMPMDSSEEPDDLGVAVLTRASDLVGKEIADLIPGRTIPPGVIAWESGLIQLEFYCGATVVAEGPATLDVLDASRVICRSGRLRAYVPEPARGFSVLSPTLELVDLGTEFGVEVTSGGETEVHVFDGVVEIYDPETNRNRQSRRELRAGDAVAVGHNGDSKSIGMRQDFVTSGRLSEIKSTRRLEQQVDWREFRDSLRNDPRVVAYFPFDRDESDDRILIGYSAEHGELAGAIVGCEWSEGRWPKKSALQFKRPGDRVRISVPGEYASLTYSTWLRVDGLDRRFNSLLLTDGFQTNAPHWQIRQDGPLILGVAHPNRAARDYETGSIFNVFRLGQWVHLATVYDSERRRVVHYVNGEQESSIPMIPEAEGQVRIGDATIGNWRRSSPAHRSTKVRNLNGCMDELIVFDTVLDGEEIKQIYDLGRP